MENGLICNDMEEETMPLKPIYEKSPLVALKELPLRPGQVRVVNEEMDQL